MDILWWHWLVAGLALIVAELAVPGWPGQWHIVADGSSALDRYRRRG